MRKDKKGTTTLLFSAVFVCADFSPSSLAVENPDAPDYVADFQNRAQVFEDAVHQQARTTQDTLKAYAEYEQFLDKELNRSYQSVSAKLDTDRKEKLKRSQREWIKYRDAEFAFIAANWTNKDFGSSATLSRGAYRTTIMRDRVMILLNYLKNY